MTFLVASLTFCRSVLALHPVRRMALVLFGLGVCFPLGCGTTTDADCSVSGQVQFNGKPVEHGAIRFVTHGSTKGPGGIGPISGGRYSVDTEGMVSGKYLVSISGFRETGKILVIDGNEVKEKLQYIPEKYNSNATDVVEINPGDNTLDFSLTP